MFFIRPVLFVSAAFVVGSVSAWVPSCTQTGPFVAVLRTSTALKALDYNDPVVAEEFAQVQPMAFEDVEEELQQSGVRRAKREPPLFPVMLWYPLGSYFIVFDPLKM